ncbi:MAG: hypothetical protein IKR76_10030 [Ruminococcus sp.]|nr:hypothetical protein [Ruminococcus sp.]
MDKQLYGLLESMSEEELIPISDLLDKTAEHCVMSDSDIDRLHSSVMRKAGLSMNNPIKVKRTKKKTAAIFLIAAAAISLCSFTAYKGIKYFYGNAFKSKLADNGKTITGNVHELESTTQPFNGVILENTFTDINFTVEGVVSDVGRDYALVTARKTDGTPFAESDEERFEAGLQMCIPCNTDYFNGKEINDTSELYWGYQSVNCELNDDGSLSITMSNDWKIGEEEYDVILGFGDLFSYRYCEEKDEEFTNYLNSFTELDNLSVYNGSETNEEYEKKLNAHKQLCHDMADDYYEGSFIIKAHISENDFIITPEENDYGMLITLSGMTCTIKGDGKSFLELSGAEPDDSGCGYVELTFRLDNGEENTVKGSFSVAEHSFITDEGFIGETDDDRSAVSSYTNFTQFTDPYKVTEILINGKTLWKK